MEEKGQAGKKKEKGQASYAGCIGSPAYNACPFSIFLYVFYKFSTNAEFFDLENIATTESDK